MSKHMAGPECPSCNEKLKQAHPDLVAWFLSTVKLACPDAHISWSFRGEADQDIAVKTGKSRAVWPKSPHNKTDANGCPQSLALDLFRLVDGRAYFPPNWYFEIADEARHQGLPILWGGEFKSIGDSDHFQLKVVGQ